MDAHFSPQWYMDGIEVVRLVEKKQKRIVSEQQ